MAVVVNLDFSTINGVSNTTSEKFIFQPYGASLASLRTLYTYCCGTAENVLLAFLRIASIR